MKKITLSLAERSYDITVGHGLLKDACSLLGVSGRSFILTDSGVPREYAECVAGQLESSRIYTVPEGEGAKSLTVLEEVLTAMLDFDMSRGDSLISVGGGVVGDLGGFAASAYMRGIAFYNIPTTMLAMVDSSIGGKTAVNLAGVKNVVGAFYQPRGVLIDTDTLKTLPRRHLSAGLCEAVKMSLTSDAELFSMLEGGKSDIEELIARALIIKKSVVEEDERESGLRKILNFGHTLGHGIEACELLGGLYHGECVALGMLPMCSEDVRKRLTPVLEGLGLPVKYNGDIDKALGYIVHDKKCKNGVVEAIFVDRVGEWRIEKMPIGDYTRLIKETVL